MGSSEATASGSGAAALDAPGRTAGSRPVSRTVRTRSVVNAAPPAGAGWALDVPPANRALSPEPPSPPAQSTGLDQHSGRIAPALWAGAAVLLLWGIATDPPFPHNWEEYTANNLFAYWEGGPKPAAFAPTGGLMTDSGRGPLVGVPVWLAFSLAGVGLGPMRVAVALVAAVAPPMLWLVGRRLLPAPQALLAALLLALSPAWLFYARTATLVGVSLVPLLLAVLALLALLAAPPGGERRPLLVLAAALAGSGFAYAPVRLVWPFAVAALLVAAWCRPGQRRALLAAGLTTAVVVPLTVAGSEALFAADPDPIRAVTRYFHARGEQALAMDQAAYRLYLRDGTAGATGTFALFGRLLAQNAGDLARLLADHETLALRTDFWNARGQFWPAAYGALALVGATASLRPGIRAGDWRPALPLLLSAWFALPLLASSRVHVGRLLPMLPFGLLLVAAGAGSVGRLVGRQLDRAEAPAWVRRAAPALAAIGLAAVATSSLVVAWRVAPVTPREARETAALAVLAPEVGEAGLTLVVDPTLGAEIERVRAAAYRLALEPIFRFAAFGVPNDQPAATATTGGTAFPAPPDRPPLWFGGALARLAAGDLPAPCQTSWAVQPEAEAMLRAALTAAGCRAATVTVLPR